MRVLLTSVTCPKGDLAGNLSHHRALLRRGRDHGCDLVLLPEMSLTGYRSSAKVRLTHPAVVELVQATIDGPAVCFGVVEYDESGGQPYITQLVAGRGQILTIHRKMHLGEGEDCEFQPGVGAGTFALAGTTCTVAVCAEIGTDQPYAQGAQVVLGPSAPGLYGERRSAEHDWRRGLDWWRKSVIDDASRLLRPDQVLMVSTQAGATDDEDFPGWAAMLETGGRVAVELPDWRQGTLIAHV